MINSNDGFPIICNGSIIPLISLYGLNSNVELSLLGKSERTYSFIAVGSVCSSIMLPIGVSLMESSEDFHQCSLMPKNVLLQG